MSITHKIAHGLNLPHAVQNSTKQASHLIGIEAFRAEQV